MTELCPLLKQMTVTDLDHSYFMTLCLLAAQRSKDPVTQVGSCVVDRKGILLGSGYNGMPRGCSDDKFPWGKSSTNPLENKHLFVCHAELNAITNSTGDLNNCLIYVTLFPCNECAKLIIQHGISEVIYLSDKNKEKASTKASKLMFDAAGVKFWQFQSKDKITVDFKTGDVLCQS